MIMPHEHKHVEHTHDMRGRVFIAFCLTTGMMLAEVIAGIFSGSLALIADAGHMLSDAVALALTYIAFYVSSKKADNRRTYGYKRLQVLVAFINGLAMFVLSGWIITEAIQRLFSPSPVLAGPMLLVAVAGLVVNFISFAVLHTGGHDNLNLRSAALHVMGDILGSAAAILAALIILWTGWYPADPLLSFLAAILILRAAWMIVKSSGHILLEGAPEKPQREEVKDLLLAHQHDLEDVHHIHIWSLTQKQIFITLHACLKPNRGKSHQTILSDLHKIIKQAYGPVHLTVQIEDPSCPDEFAKRS